MQLTQAPRQTAHRGLAMLLGCLAVLTPLAASAQVVFRPADRPIVTADGERWYLEGQAISYWGGTYYPAGAAVFFNPYEMVRSGDFRGIPLYALKTRDPYGVMYVPVDRGLMRPYERRRAGEMAGTVGSSAPSFPVARDSEATAPDTGLQAIAAPDLGQFTRAHGPDATDTRDGSQPPVAGPDGRWFSIPVALGPLTTALKPTGLNAFYIDYQGSRWFSKGGAVLLDPTTFTRAGEYYGFPVYVVGTQPATTIYVPVAGIASGLLTPYSTQK